MTVLPAHSEDNRLFSALLDDLRQDVLDIDLNGRYPKNLLQQFASTELYQFRDEHGSINLTNSIQHSTDIAAICVNTAFCVWCHSACIWYLHHTSNQHLRQRHLHNLEQGYVLGATGFSNPMKYAAGIENTIKIKAQPVNGGFILNGALPWVSNLEYGNLFGAMAQLPNGHQIAVLIDTTQEGVIIRQQNHHIALNGSATAYVRLRDYFLAEENLLAEEGEAFLKLIRPGFILLQLAMAFGNITGSLNILSHKAQERKKIKHLYHDFHQLNNRFTQLQKEVAPFLKEPYAQSPEQLQRILSLRLSASQLALDVGQTASLASGAGGYAIQSEANRKLRESHWIAIVSPSINQLRTMLQHST